MKDNGVLKELFESGMMAQKAKRWVVWESSSIHASMEEEGRECNSYLDAVVYSSQLISGTRSIID